MCICIVMMYSCGKATDRRISKDSVQGDFRIERLNATVATLSHATVCSSKTASSTPVMTVSP